MISAVGAALRSPKWHRVPWLSPALRILGPSMAWQGSDPLWQRVKRRIVATLCFCSTAVCI